MPPPPVAEAVERLRARFAGPDSWFANRDREAQAAKAAGDAAAKRGLVARIGAEIPAFFEEVSAAAQEAAIAAGPADVPIGTRMAYLAEQSLPDKLRLPELARNADPFRILVNPGQASVDVPLFPGETAITVAGVASRQLGQTIAGFVTEAQAILGHAGGREPPGRRPRKDDPAKADRARTAAKLHHWPSPGWSHAEIAELFGWGGSPDTVRERVRLAVRDGEELLKDELGPGWHLEPPPGIAERRC
ncbi:MAG: hypothetical protein M3Q10_01895 [Chloroflexota bacterium]|nr:hypothetical protein [Chloroflexota bacterium]